MKILAKKMKSFGILRVQMILGAIVMAVAMIALPVALLVFNPSLLLDPYVLGVVLIGMLIFGFFAYFTAIRPYFLYQKTPDVLVETDGTYLYIHGKKEAKILLTELDGTSTFVHLPFLYSNEFASVFATYMLSEKYGDIDLDIPGYGEYKLRFVSDVTKTSNNLIAYINEVLNRD